MRLPRALAFASLLMSACSARLPPPHVELSATPLARVEHLVVIYEENRSFDNLWGLWPGVDGLARPASSTPRQRQVDRQGNPYECLPQVDVNLTQATPANPCSAQGADSRYRNELFRIDDFVPSSARTCPMSGQEAKFGVRDGDGEPGGCTMDLVHRFFQEQYQINGGRMDRYTAASNAAGLTQGYYDTRALPLYQYLTGPGAPRHVILDHFFHAAFGGSFLNHFWLVSARTPVWPHADVSDTANNVHAAVGNDGLPTRDGALTPRDDGHGTCLPAAGSAPPPGTACGDYAVNTLQPSAEPKLPKSPPALLLPALDGTHRTIGTALDDAEIDWAWYAGGWDNAAGNTARRGWTNGAGPTCADPETFAGATYPHCPNALFQFHHQPFNYFAAYAPGTKGRAHLRDEADFRDDLRAGRLPAVAFVKPLGAENEHPGYTGVERGDRHLVELIRAIEADGADWPTTAIVITYDENGGQWDHVPPPNPSTAPGSADRWGPGTRVPSMIISPLLPQPAAVDHTPYDTTSILTTIEHLFRLPGRLSPRPDVPDLANAFARDVSPLPAPAAASSNPRP